MPKAGTRYPIDDEWKEALRLRLDELKWGYSDLARKVGVTTAAISHMFKSADATTIRPEIEAAVGLPGDGTPSVGGIGSQRTALRTLRSIVNSDELTELIAYFQVLKTENRTRVLERARMLWEDEDRERKTTAKRT